MVEILRIPTEDPKREQWQLLGQYGYPENARKHFHKKPTVLMGSDLPEYIAGCVNQGQSYFSAFDKSDIGISPLLLYYGVSNLMFGVASLISGYKREIHHHGLKLKEPTSDRYQIADFELRPCNEGDGALQWFIDRFSDGTSVTKFGTWTLEEVFASIPDLRGDFENCYIEAKPFTIPVSLKALETRYRNDDSESKTVVYEQINSEHLARFDDPHSTLLSVPGFQDAYLVPTSQELPLLDLYRKMRAEEIGFYTTFGRKFLEIPHNKSGVRLSPGQLILLFMGLFALGHVSRYYPQFWNVFVKSDTTGERLVVERFLAIAERYVPNLLLSQILGSHVEFFHPGSRRDLESPRFSLD